MRFPIETIRKFWPRLIWQQIFFILAPFVVVSLITLGSFQINTSKDAVKTSVLRDHKEIAIRAAGEIGEFLKGPKETLQVTAAILGTLHADPWRQETAIVELALRYPIFRKIVSINDKGQEIATSSLGMPLRDRSQDMVFLKAISGEAYVSKVYISDDHLPMMTWAFPIKQLGQITGVLLAEVNLRGVWDIMDSIKIGKTGRAYLVDEQGLVIAHPDKKIILKNKNFLHQKAVREVITGNTGSQEEADQEGQRWLIAHAPVQDIHWGLIIFQSQNEAYAFLQTMLHESGILIIFGIVFAVMISMFFSKLMSRPIERLVRGTENISQGNFDQPLVVDREDEMGQLLKAFNSMTFKLKEAKRMEKLSTIGQAASAIIHAIKTPLTLVNTYIQLLPEEYENKKFIKKTSEVVPRELNTCQTMLENLVDYSKITQFPKRRMSIKNLIEEIAVLVHEQARQNKINFCTYVNKNLPFVNGNKDKIKEVLLNLVANAFEATHVGGTIEISADLYDIPEMDEKPYICIKVKDTGKGISSRNLERIFDSFFTTKVNGLGLGLAICKEIVEYHGGFMEVSSELKKGTIFTLYFPSL